MKMRAVYISCGFPAVLTALCCILFVSCGKTRNTVAPALPKGERHLGAHLSLANDGNYAAAYAKARTAGIDCVPLTLQWSAMESNGHYDSAGLLGNLNSFYGAEPVTLSVCVSPFAADRRDMPADLLATSFDDTAMISRFNLLLDTLHARLDKVKLRYLLLGNEADLYLSGHASEWNAYTFFCQAVRQHAQKLWGPDLKTGAETTLGATIGGSKNAIRVLQDSMDLLCLTYYPLRSDFFMQPAAQARNDFAALFSLYPSRPVLFQECGYATGLGCGGSDSAQVDFVKTIFSLWDERKDQIGYVAFLWLNDLSMEQADQVASEYGLAGTDTAPAFTAYVRTLGLCDYTGAAKPGYITLQQEAAVRGWP